MSELEFTFVEVPLDRRVAAELESAPHLGGSDGFDDDSFSAFIGDQPIALRLKDVYAKLGLQIPPEIQLYDAFEVWLVPHRFSLIRKKGNAEPTSVGMEIEYVHQGRTCSVISLFPGPTWQQHGKVSVATTLSGKISSTGEISELLPPDVNVPLSFSVGHLGFAANVGGEIALSLKWSIATPIISAVGQGGAQCQWHFKKAEEPLFGKTLETWSVLALPKRQKVLEYRMRCYYTRRTLFFPTRRDGDFVQVKCQLVP